jgi:hypothetical protein
VAKHWAVYCLDCIEVPIMLFPVGTKPRRKVRHGVENTLIMCVCWLARSYKSSTVTTYIGHVKALLGQWHGHEVLEDLGFTWSRLHKALRILRTTRPVSTREKRPFTFHMMLNIARYWKAKGRAAMSFTQKCMWTAMVLCFNQLLRGNEVAQSSTFSFANRIPMVHAHIKHYGSDGRVICSPVSSADAMARVHMLSSSKLEMPPSKCDPEANNLPLYLIAAVGGVEEWLSPATQIFLLQGESPVVDRAEAQYCVLFPASKKAVQPITATNLLKVAKSMCSKASIDPSNLGTHAFRVGGMNHLQESGATIAQIMAIGRWSSDAWKLYSRRNRKRLVVWSQKLTQQAQRD